VWTEGFLQVSVGVSGCQPKNTSAVWQLTYYNTGEKLDFNAAGQLLTAYDRNGNKINYAYNGIGQVTTTTDTQGRTYSYTYPSGQERSPTTATAGR
jgi:YD repeat-containing protein